MLLENYSQLDNNKNHNNDDKKASNYQESGRGLNANSEDTDVGLDLFSIDDNVSQISGLVADELTRTPVQYELHALLLVQALKSS